MPSSTQATYRKYYLHLLLLVAAGCLASCGEHRNDGLFQSAFKAYDQQFRNGNKSAVIRSIDSLFFRYPDASPFYQYRRYFFKKSYYFYAGKPDSINMYVDSMLWVLETARITQDHTAEYAQALNEKGDYYYRHEDFSRAFEYYYRARAAAVESHDHCLLGDQSYHLGMISYKQEKYAIAAGYFKESFNENESCGEDSMKFFTSQELLNNIALSYTRLGLTDSAGAYYNKALDYVKTRGGKFGGYVQKFAEMASGVIYGDLAKVFISRGQWDTARALLLQSIAINIRPGFDNNDAMLAQMQLAELYFASNDYAACDNVLGELGREQDSIHNSSVELRRRLLMYNYKRRMNDPAHALEFLESYLSLRDTLDAQQKKLDQTDYQQVFRSQEEEYLMHLLKKDRELSKLYLWIAAGFTIVVLAIIGQVYLNYRRSKRSVKELQLLNRQITSQKAALEQTTDELRKSNDDKSRILQVVAHDLRNPIGSIMMLGNLVLEEENNESNRELLEMIVSASRSSLSLINDVLDYRGDAAHGQEMHKERLELNELMWHTAGLLQFKAGEKKQKITVTPADAPVYVMGNKENLNRMLSNLLSNAIKFSPAGAEVAIRLRRDGDRAIIEVTDHGIGIPASLLPTIFDSFTSARRNGTAGEKSFGLGLSICRQIALAHGGTINVESAEGKGATFFVNLPCAS